MSLIERIKFVLGYGGNKSLLGEFWDFMRIRKKWWLLPTIILLVLVGVLIIRGLN